MGYRLELSEYVLECRTVVHAKQVLSLDCPLSLADPEGPSRRTLSLPAALHRKGHRIQALGDTEDGLSISNKIHLSNLVGLS